MTFADGFTQSFKPSPSKPRKPLMRTLGVWLGVVAAWLVSAWASMRRVVLYVSGFGFIAYALFLWNPIAGFAAIGVSLLTLEFLSGDNT